jgi:hypothetical protein
VLKNDWGANVREDLILTKKLKKNFKKIICYIKKPLAKRGYL